MPRILAIDYGSKRTGIAVTDPLKLIASALTTLPTEQLLSFLKEYCQKEAVEKIIIGQPKRLNNQYSPIEEEITIFIKNLTSEIQIPIQRFDERFTSKIAFQTMIDSGLKKKQRQNKALIDEISATIILQDYLNQVS